MITAVDTNVLLDVFAADPTYAGSSGNAFRSCISDGNLVACEVVWAEVGAFFIKPDDAVHAMEKLGVEFSSIDRSTALNASRLWKLYRKRGGKRIRILPDFLIGAHALENADRLLTRDSAFYRLYFSDLSVIDPGR